MSSTINQNLEEPKLGCLPVRGTLITLSILGLIGSCLAMSAVSVVGLALFGVILAGSYYYNGSLLNVCGKVMIFLTGLAIVVAVYLLLADFTEMLPVAIGMVISAAFHYGYYVMIRRLRQYIEAKNGAAELH
ncbi:Protein CBG27259 [Caenorhabditis briggsae]|uniref:Protein CBG27259 n=1 Tax=Caenorhabditis briggsae TaxID=6238 RepID=B6IFS9_CAEBR|nr:Protein CBG27259 [Caenorhabditis briggsae]CAR98797.1 Protein CBG27259 [Caenorhabditis briggsae]